MICLGALFQQRNRFTINESDNRIETKTGNGCTLAWLAQTGEPIPDKPLIPKLQKSTYLIFEPLKS
jgi:hypothetical protein